MPKLTFIDNVDLTRYEWTSEEVIDQAIHWITDRLLPEAFNGEIDYYHEVLKSLQDPNRNLQLRLADAIDILESVSIYEKEE